MSKMRQLMAAALMMGAMASGVDMFGTGHGGYHRDPWEGETDEDRKRRLRKMYGDNSQEHEFVVKGERIMAHDKKTALKIYANRHPENKKRKKK